MGNFVHHSLGAGIVGIFSSGAAVALYSLSISDAAACGIIAGISALLPDIDSPKSKPSEFVAETVSALAPALALQAVRPHSLTPSHIVVATVCSYFLSRTLIKTLLKKTTVHRGMIHSIPVAIIWGCIVFLLYKQSGSILQNIMGASALIGFLTHLLIDEMFSMIDISGGTFAPKRSFGTALKFGTKNKTATAFVYLLLSMALYACWVY